MSSNCKALGFKKHIHGSGTQRWLDGALKLAEIKHQHGVCISRDLAYRLAHECTKIRETDLVRRMQALIIQGGLDSVPILGQHLIRLYASCGSLEEGNQAFHKVSTPTQCTWDAILDTHSRLGKDGLVFCLYEMMHDQGMDLDKLTILSLLKVCSCYGALAWGRYIHSQIWDTGLQYDILVGSSVVDMYAKCRCLEEAHRVFATMPNRNEVTWNALIAGYIQIGENHAVLECFENMKQESRKPDRFTFPSILKACCSIGMIGYGRCIHEEIVEIGLQSHVVVGSTLVDMYAKYQKLEEARRVFDHLTTRNTVTWNVMISGYAQLGYGNIALECFQEMLQGGLIPSKATVTSILKACSSIGNIEQGRWIHEQVMEELQSDIVMGSAIVDMYAKCGSLEEARKVFDELAFQDVVSWGAIIAGYAYHDEGLLALECFENMRLENVEPSKCTFLSTLKACGNVSAIVQGRYIHEEIAENEFQVDIIVGSAVVDMYIKCNNLAEARSVFNKLPDKNVVAWGVMIAGYAEHGKGHLAVQCFEDMQQEGIESNKVIYLGILKAYAGINAVEKARCVHEQILDSRLSLDVMVGSTLVDMYAKSGNLEEACVVFNKLPDKNVVTWGALISGFAQYGEGLAALDCYDAMQCLGIKPDKFTYSSVIKACSSIGAIQKGNNIYECIMKEGFQSDIVVGSALVDMYSKCGCLEDAYLIFKGLPERNVVSWGAMIAAYALLGEAGMAVQCFEDTKHHNIKPNDIIFTGILTALSRAGLVEEGLHYFETMRDCHGIKPDTCHVTCMVDLLGRAGCFNEGEKLLEDSMQSDACLWTTLLSACNIYGNVELGRRCFDGIIDISSHCIAAYVLMSNIYATAHMMEDAYEIDLRRHVIAFAENPVLRNSKFLHIDDNVKREKHYTQAVLLSTTVSEPPSAVQLIEYFQIYADCRELLDLILKIVDQNGIRVCSFDKEDAWLKHRNRMCILR